MGKIRKMDCKGIQDGTLHVHGYWDWLRVRTEGKGEHDVIPREEQDVRIYDTTWQTRLVILSCVT